LKQLGFQARDQLAGLGQPSGLGEDSVVMGVAFAGEQGSRVNTPEYLAPRKESGASAWVPHPRALTAFERRLAGSEAWLEGMLRSSSSDWFGTFMLAPVLAEFGRRHPNVYVELLTDARLSRLPRREADMAFRITPFDEAEVISRRLLHMPYALYGPAGSDVPRSGDGRRADRYDGYGVRWDAGHALVGTDAAGCGSGVSQQQPGCAGASLRAGAGLAGPGLLGMP
jgi:DNA-binding transcriptional LysR family regulator